MESTVCPISGETAFEPVLEVADRFNPGSCWQIVRSRRSGLLMLNPRPSLSEIGICYHEKDYDPHLHATAARSLHNWLYLAARSLLLGRKASMVLHGIEKPADACRILEIGCSTGDLLRHMNRVKGIPIDNLRGIETDPEAAAVAEAATGITIERNATGRTANRGAFDRIVLWHAFEHVHDLHDLLNNIAEQLDQRGTIVMALPNPASRDAQHYRKHWVAWDAPRHLWHFTPATLKTLLSLHALECYRIVPYRPDTIYNCWHSEKNAATNAGRTFTVRALAGALAETAATMALSVVRPLQASTLVYYFRKSE
ncbi:MAG: class I SAM-dependent methyltransferase [Chlorobium sp.]|jgi:2-polyprenyl-3-methyl-5-hydroxy-6-metoxy-1,4-benzoquinol methylase|uniref:class I SAM-dependent methyltransferase n=1 Tax=Chlorobium sp. TaxID=1095 RepID=UPI001DBCE254|nr:class I SAM-dependent methyltransferase [Chlorobium sp.]MBN1279520.1 class I SAM-dependent methyltransferase [Chlorobiaceae bacterium]MCF8216421.1 class I SAM-dependent methyltransferase [Chlorobium sp.]MCF8271324.1 class I SAM-dependent methyltransferase [Chlorobium sp.]MCF8287698.1 class I SAM-dependent methyltransferase [Chlorobium sp.]MCF8291237.1 class I SAM-dependent methyltransferase [Chlorobium sp.]